MKLFLNACGINDTLRLQIEDRNRSDVFQMSFQRPFVVIGRNSDCDLSLDHWQISRRHAYLQVIDGRLFCLDLGSRTGTHWEGPAGRFRWLGDREAITIGPYRIRSDSTGGSRSDEKPALAPPQTSSTGTSIAPAAGLLPGVTLAALNEREESTWRMEQALALFGRSPICEIRLTDPVLSKFHASLVRTTLGVWVVDLLGSGGMTINRTRLRCARLADGDEFYIGRHGFRLHYDDPQAVPDVVDEEPVTSSSKTLASMGGSWLPASSETAWGDSSFANDERELENVPEAVAIAQALLAPMLNQFAMMQQQMFEQFHQTMMAMMQSMHAMHQDRMDLVQQEMAEVRRLTRELHELQAESLRQAEAQRLADAERRAEPRRQADDRRRPETQPEPPVAAPRPSPSPSPTPTRPQTPIPGGASTPKSAPTRTPTVSPPRSPASSVPPAASGSAPRPSSTAPRPNPAKPQVDAHHRLQERISLLQTERQTRWQKILAMVGGQSSHRS